MPDPNAVEKGARKVLPIIYVLDISGSMSGNPIGALNQAMSETMPVLREIEATNTGAQIKIGALTFATDVHWVSNGLEEIDDFFWNDVTAGGLTALGAALNELNDKMSRNAMFQSDTGFKLPVLIFLSDGAPTDGWETALATINQENKWFANSTKIAIALGQSADKDVLTKVVDNNPEAVISVDDLETLKKLIPVLSATASKIGSVSKINHGQGNVGQIIDETKGGIGMNDPSNGEPQVAPAPTPAPAPDPSSNPSPSGGWEDDDWK